MGVLLSWTNCSLSFSSLVTVDNIFKCTTNSSPDFVHNTALGNRIFIISKGPENLLASLPNFVWAFPLSLHRTKSPTENRFSLLVRLQYSSLFLCWKPIAFAAASQLSFSCIVCSLIWLLYLHTKIPWKTAEILRASSGHVQRIAHRESSHGTHVE